MTWDHDGHSGAQGSIHCFLLGKDGPVLGRLGCGKDRLPSREKVPVPGHSLVLL